MKRSLLRQFQISLLSMLLILILLIVGCYRFVVDQRSAQIARGTETDMRETAERLSREVRNITYAYSSIGNNTDVYRFMTGSAGTRVELRDGIRFMLTACLNMNSSIDYAYLIMRDGAHMTVYPDTRPAPDSQTAGAVYRECFMNGGKTPEPFRGVKVLPYITCMEHTFYAVMIPVYPSTNQIADTEFLGELILLCGTEGLTGYFAGAGETDTLIVYGDDVVAGTSVRTENLWRQGVRDGMLSVPVQGVDWTVWTRAAEASPENARFRMICLAYALCVTVVFSFLMLILYKKVVGPIRDLERQTVAVASGSMQAIDSRSDVRELDSLAGSVNTMLDAQRRMSDEVRRLEADAYESRILFLQAQINPHFLYNNFEMIRGMACAGMTEEIRETASCSAAVYRYCCRPGQAVRLRDEFACVQQYSRIISLCYRDAYRCEPEMDEDAGDYAVPRMLLQPLAENAVLHGFIDCRRKQGVISIAARLTPEGLRLTVEDNGGGMPEETLRQLNDEEMTESGGGNGRIGARNVLRRLRLMYGDSVKTHFETREEGGSRVTILFSEPEKMTSETE